MRLFSLFLAVVFISSCAPTRYPSSHQQPADSVHLGEGGKVKRGNPYQIENKWYYPLASGDAYDEVGVASWYGEKFHGLKTANGETYNMYAMTAAHTTLPMPSLVRVTNLENDKTIIVRVNDRGPFVKSRLIDLSYAAAKALGTIEKGTARVRVQTIKSADVSEEQVKLRPVPITQPVVSIAELPETIETKPSLEVVKVEMAYVQVGAFSLQDKAEKVVNNLKKNQAHHSAKVFKSGELFRVRLGPFDLDADAAKTLQSVKADGYTEAMVIHD